MRHDSATRQGNNHHEEIMKHCIRLAQQARQRGDSPVGAVIVRDGQLIGSGIEGGKTHQDITCHAEIEAIRQATKQLQTQDLSDCMLYTTHEPCIMCSYVIRHTGIHTVVIGVTSGEIGGVSSALPVLLDQTIQRWRQPPMLITGVLEQECRAL